MLLDILECVATTSDMEGEKLVRILSSKEKKKNNKCALRFFGPHGKKKKIHSPPVSFPGIYLYLIDNCRLTEISSSDDR